ncbi:MAG: type II secretion system F family protein [Candidatus Omnitrophica bacterium]|jgi:type IV pilus assembly protein PilC|nr:type II secretion system F family protein [Candidatus Omnitrophota bacterium]
MKFVYKAKKNLNEIVEGRIEGQNIEQVLEELQAKGLVTLSLEPLEPIPSNAPSAASLKLKSGRWGSKQLVLFTQKLYSLINSRVELLNALRLLEKNSTTQVEKSLLGDLIKRIKDGESFSGCLSYYPQYFPRLYVNIIHTGESTGKLKEALIQLLDYLRRLEDLKLKVKQALAYPIFMSVVGAGAVFVMLTFVLPKLAAMFEDFQSELPLPTRILLDISSFLKNNWIYIILVVIALVFYLRFKKPGQESAFSRLKYRIPIAKDIIYKQSVANFSRSLSLLLQSGVNLLTALKDASALIGNPIYAQQLELVRKDISEGVSFSEALGKFNIFPDLFVQMIRVGEEGGRLDVVLADIAASYEDEIEADLKTVSSLIEPAIILVLGVIIGAMVIAMLLPIFNMSSLTAT